MEWEPGVVSPVAGVFTELHRAGEMGSSSESDISSVVTKISRTGISNRLAICLHLRASHYKLDCLPLCRAVIYRRLTRFPGRFMKEKGVQAPTVQGRYRRSRRHATDVVFDGVGSRMMKPMFSSRDTAQCLARAKAREIVSTRVT